MAGRRANGEGTIYRRGDGRYEGAVYLPTTSGRTKRVRVYARTRAEARDKLAETVAKTQRGLPMPDKVWRVGDYLEYWLENVVCANRRLTTYSRYEVTVRLHLKPSLGAQMLERLSVPVVQSFFNQKLEQGCSVRAAHIMREVLSAALTNAQREELTSRNVARLITLPTYEAGEIKPWTVDEASKFLEAVTGSAHYPIFAFMMLYGLRRGEALGLRWQDIDFDANEIRIRQQLQRVKGLLYQAPLKTKAGKRDLPLLGFTRQLIVAHRAQQELHRPGIEAQLELVFMSGAGTPIEPRNLSRSFERLCQLHGLRTIRLHDLRHTTATLLKNLGVPARDAQLILGHADISTTQSIYQHDDMESRRQSLGRIEKLLLSQQEFVGDGSRSRQISRQQPRYTRKLASLTTVIHGRSGGIRTPDPRFWSSNSTSLKDRLTSINLAVRGRRRAWILGCVAVKLAVKPDADNTDPIATREGSTG
ncbi:site-specific integrase [Micromonospora sp. Llam7]|uniref:tyrosine-type recombinase/integrase n=1 Tax=Micromonospora tarapacensis TaxID=2835305 RepID=UPI001C83E94E|nr:site-specific integrase [Micromonospora tarapacensis]MBX7268829.1 site-specific integrase [Micromonospora tarapacensis]